MSTELIRPRTLYVSTLRLAAVLTAVPCARMFVRHILDRWNLHDHTDTAELVASELVGNAVKAVGITTHDPKLDEIKRHHVVGVQLRVTDGSLFVEVFDTSSEEPTAQHPTLDTESGRGLLLVETLTKTWDIHRPPTGGKVVWAELELSEAAELPNQRIPLPMRVPADSAPPDGPVSELVSRALLERVLECLHKL